MCKSSKFSLSTRTAEFITSIYKYNVFWFAVDGCLDDLISELTGELINSIKFCISAALLWNNEKRCFQRYGPILQIVYPLDIYDLSIFN